MRRVTTTPRPDWRDRVRRFGLVYDTPGTGAGGVARPYWDESVYYEFSTEEIDSLEADVELLHSMCLDAVEKVVTTGMFHRFGIPEWVWPAITESWRRRDPHVYGRFDLRYDGTGPARLLEYNADTPTSLLEASIIQWNWHSEVLPGLDQWNSLHERLVERWAQLRSGLARGETHFTHSAADASGEDHVTMAYLQETAAEAGLDTVGLAIEEIGWDPVLNRFVDLENTPVTSVFKLYPWEWMLTDPFGRHAVSTLPATLWIEPLWKCLLSNKTLLAVLWENHPGHPNLLPAFVDDPGPLTEYVRKPKLGREGANVRIVAPGYEQATGGVYGAEGHVYQAFDPLGEFDGYRPVLGAWMVGDNAAGLGIRETVGLVTDNSAAFVPHVFRDV